MMDKSNTLVQSPFRQNRDTISRRIGLRNMILLCVAYGTMITIGFFTPIAIIVATFAIAFSFFFESLEDIVCQMLFLVSFSAIFKFSVSGTSMVTLLELYVIVLCLLRYRRISIKELVCSMLLASLLLLALLFNENPQITFSIKLIVLPLLVSYFKMTDHRKQLPAYIIMMTAGLLYSSLVAYVFRDLPILRQHLSTLKLYVHTTEGMQLSNIVRFTGLYPDPNYYAVNMFIAISGLLILRNYGKMKHTAFTYISVITLLVFGVLTVSKSFFLMTFMVALYIFIVSIRQKHFGAALLLLGATAVFVLLLFSGWIDGLNLLLNRFEASNDINDLTSNRWVIWNNYLNYLKENPILLFVGSGLGNDFGNLKAAHNTVIESIASLGIIGTGIMGISVVSLLKRKEKFKWGLGNFTVLIIVVITYLFLSMLTWVDLPFHLYLCYCFLDYPLVKYVPPKEIKKKKIKKTFERAQQHNRYN